MVLFAFSCVQFPWKTTSSSLMLNLLILEICCPFSSSIIQIPSSDESAYFVSASHKMGKINGYNQQSSRKKDTVFTWTNVFTTEETSADTSEVSVIRAAAPDVTDSKDTTEIKRMYWKMIFGEEPMKISPKEPYGLRCAIRSGHFIVSPHYSAQQVQPMGLLYTNLLVPQVFPSQHIHDIGNAGLWEGSLDSQKRMDAKWDTPKEWIDSYYIAAQAMCFTNS